MITEVLQAFPEQFAWNPVVENAAALARADSFVVCGMGGSNLAPALVAAAYPHLSFHMHKDYGLPRLAPDAAAQSLFVFISYSGNTEEILDGFEHALHKKLSVAVIATGGTLLARAKERSIPYIQLPATGIQPRAALGFMVRALARIIGDETVFAESGRLAELLGKRDFMQQGKALAGKLHGKIPVISASSRLRALAYNWKIKFNEGAKIPAFYSVFPELNHNEMNGFDAINATRSLSEKFHCIFLTDPAEDPRMSKRMRVCKELYEARGVPVTVHTLAGETMLEKIFRASLVADWAAYYLAQQYGTEPEQVPMVEEFKKLIV
ncbi:MAG: SIS domain-containing protein [Patescibacteria group bacterium]